MEVKQINSVQELLGFYETQKNNDVIYRGVSKSTHRLVPKIGRPKTIKAGWTRIAEEQLIIQFKLRAQPHLEHLPRSESDWLVIGQHHGLPTRLLDWTENPLVATFFAVDQDGGRKSDAAIYVETLPQTVSSTIDSVFDIQNVEFLFPVHIAKRISAQAGVFTVHHKPTTPYDTDTLIKLVIPSDLRFEIQQTLDTFGINKASLFPDLDGISGYFSWKSRWTDSLYNGTD